MSSLVAPRSHGDHECRVVAEAAERTLLLASWAREGFARRERAAYVNPHEPNLELVEGGR